MRVADFAERRRELAADPYRPAYHFIAPYGWLNDPNGTVFWKGKWHLFYQYFPDMFTTGGAANWGHAVSDDLVTWTDLPIALSPTPGTYDEKGCWSGTSLVEEDRVIANYHAHQGGNCIATSSDEMLTEWVKLPENPVIPFDPAKTYDPCIWREGGTYYSLSGRITGARYGDGRDQEFGGHDLAYLYKSTDLVHWEYVGVFYEGGRFTNPGEDCACPDFFSIGDKHMLLFLSHNQGAQYYIGTYENERFTPERHGRMNFTKPTLANLTTCGDVAAPIAWKCPDGRRVVIAWISEGRGHEAMKAAGWAGILSLPRDVFLLPDGNLGIRPVPELETLRGQHTGVANIELGEWEGPSGDTLEIHAVIEPKDADRIGMSVRRSPDGAEETVVAVDLRAGTLTIDPSRSSLAPGLTGLEAQVAPLPVAPGEVIDLRVFVDRSIVEVFANGRQCVTKRIYPSRPDSLGVRLFSLDGKSTLRTLDAWEMRAVWPVERPCCP